HLTFTTQPGGVSRTGSPLATQPVVKAQDQFGNVSTVGLPPSLSVTLALSAGSGSLLGTTILDIGTAAASGIGSFTNLQCSLAGTNKQLNATAVGLTGALSALFSVGGVETANGGNAISADTAGGAYTTLTGPVYYEAASADVGAGTQHQFGHVDRGSRGSQSAGLQRAAWLCHGGGGVWAPAGGAQPRPVWQRFSSGSAGQQDCDTDAECGYWCAARDRQPGHRHRGGPWGGGLAGSGNRFCRG